MATSAFAEETSTARFDVRLIGAKVGEMVMASTQTNTGYSVRSRFATTGAVKALKQVRFDVSARGRMANGRHVPVQYAEETEEGRRSTNLKISFRNGVATNVTGDTGSSAPPADASTLRGALDPMTALYAALQDQPDSALCRLNTDVYDGHRHAKLTLTKRTEVKDAVRCSGTYRRIAGYSERELRHRTAPVAVLYQGSPEKMQAQTVTVRTSYGKVTMHRR